MSRERDDFIREQVETAAFAGKRADRLIAELAGRVFDLEEKILAGTLGAVDPVDDAQTRDRLARAFSQIDQLRAELRDAPVDAGRWERELNHWTLEVPEGSITWSPKGGLVVDSVDEVAFPTPDDIAALARIMEREDVADEPEGPTNFTMPRIKGPDDPRGDAA